VSTEEITEISSESDTDVTTLWRPSPRTLLSVLVTVLGALVLLDIAAFNSSIETGERFSLDAETALPTWWASVQLLLLSLMFGLLAVRERRAGRREAARLVTIGALVAAFFSLDETAAMWSVLAISSQQTPWT